MLIYDDLGKLVTSVEDQGEELLCLETFSWQFPTSGIYVKHKTDGFIELLVPLTLQQVREIKEHGGVENVNGIGNEYHPLPFPIYNNKPPFPYYLFSDKTPDEPVTDVINEVLDLSKVEYFLEPFDFNTNQYFSTYYIGLRLYRKDGSVYMDDDNRITVKYAREGIGGKGIAYSYNEAYHSNFNKDLKQYRFVVDAKYFYYHMVFTVNDVRIGKGLSGFDENGNIWIEEYYYDFTMSLNEPNPSQFVDVARANINYSFDKNTKRLQFKMVLPSNEDGTPFVNERKVSSHLRLDWIELDDNGEQVPKTRQCFLRPDEVNGCYYFDSDEYLSDWKPTETLIVIPFVNNVRLQGINPFNKFGELIIIKPKKTKK